MNTTLPKILVFGLALATIITLTRNYPSNVWALLTVGLLVNIVSAPISFFIVESLANLKRLPLLFKTKILFRNQYIRMSFAYLIKIKVDGKYLLVKNRKGDYYQFVGGAYKRYDSSETVFEKYSVKSDRQFETEHGIAKNDLRIHVPGKHVLDIINWFNAKKDREISQWREFCEELLSTGILDKKLFRYVDYKYVGTLQTPIQKAKYLNCQEIILYEIFELIPNNEQLKALELLLNSDANHNVRWAGEMIINGLGFNEWEKEKEFEIGAHTKWAINLKYTHE